MADIGFAWKQKCFSFGSGSWQATSRLKAKTIRRFIGGFVIVYLWEWIAFIPTKNYTKRN